MRPAPHRLVNRVDGPLCQDLLTPGQEAKVRDKSPQEESQPQIRPNLHLQESSLRVSTSPSFITTAHKANLISSMWNFYIGRPDHHCIIMLGRTDSNGL